MKKVPIAGVMSRHCELEAVNFDRTGRSGG